MCSVCLCVRANTRCTRRRARSFALTAEESHRFDNTREIRINDHRVAALHNGKVCRTLYWCAVVFVWILGLSYRYVCRQKCHHVHLNIVKCVGLFHRYMGLFYRLLGVPASFTGMCASKNVSTYTRVFVRCVGLFHRYVRLFQQRVGVQISFTGMCVGKSVSIYTWVFVRSWVLFHRYVGLFCGCEGVLVSFTGIYMGKSISISTWVFVRY